MATASDVRPDGRAQKRVRDEERGVLRVELQRAPVERHRLLRVAPSGRLGPAGEQGRLARHLRQRPRAGRREELRRFLVLDAVRVQLERRLEPLGRLLRPPAVEIAEAELVERVLVVGIEAHGLLERLGRLGEPAALVRDRAEKRIGLRVLVDRDGLLQERLRARELALEREERAEREVTAGKRRA